MKLSVCARVSLARGAAQRTRRLAGLGPNAFNAVVYNARQTQLQLVSPTTPPIRNSQFLADGTVDPNRLKTTSAGFGAVTGRSRSDRSRRSCGSRSEVSCR